MKSDKMFDITIIGVNFKSNDDGMLDLNDIWRGCGLHNAKRPSQWRGVIKDNLIRYANLHSVNGDKGSTVGDEIATTAYAMWVSVDFYRTVVEAFVALRQGNIIEAAKLADTTQLEAKAFSKWMGYADTTLQQTLGMIGINRPNLFQSIAKNGKQLNKFLQLGVLKYRNYGDKGTHLRVTKVGKQYLLDNRDTINTRVEEIYQSNKELM